MSSAHQRGHEGGYAMSSAHPRGTRGVWGAESPRKYPRQPSQR
jgi:hypothetical protein